MVREGLTRQMTFEQGPVHEEVAMQSSGQGCPEGAVPGQRNNNCKDFVAGMNFGYLRKLLEFSASGAWWFG